MERRALLGGLAGVGLAWTAGCLGPVQGLVGGEPLELRVMRASEGDTDVTCDLPEPWVAARPELEALLDEAADAPKYEWRTTRISRAHGDRLVSALEARCARAGGLYFYEGEPFFVSVAFTSSEDAADHHAGDGHAGHNHTTTTTDG